MTLPLVLFPARPARRWCCRARLACAVHHPADDAAQHAYPSTAYLTGFLRSRGVDAVQEDLALA